MAQELKKVDIKRCYACIQWDGQRTWYPAERMVRVDESREGHCRMFHEKRKGSATCERFTVMG